jgi:hypothetical protein
MLMQEPPFLGAMSSVVAVVAGVADTRGPGALPEDATLDEERREIVASVLSALAGNPPNPDEMAACSYLLKHLSQTARRPGPRVS